jgi:hypothetical protein
VKERKVRAHIRCSPVVFERLKNEIANDTTPRKFWPNLNNYELKVDAEMPDEWIELVEAHTIKPFHYIGLGKQFWFRGDLYVNPLDERLLDD